MRRRLVLSLVSLAAGLPIAGAVAQSPRIIENPRPTWKPGEALRLSSVPVMVIGTKRGPMYEFDRVAGSARLKDGRIVVADGGGLSLRFFDSTGTFLQAVGRRGAGPGEFQNLRSFFYLTGDTLVAGATERDLSYFTGTGHYLDRYGSSIPPEQIATLGVQLTLAPLEGRGKRVVGMMRPPSRTGTGTRSIDSFPLAIVDATNGELAKLGTFPSMEMASDGTRPVPVWLGAVATFASDGQLFYIGFGSEYSIRVYTSRGVLDHVIHRAWTPHPLTNADIDRYVDGWAQRYIKSTGPEAAAERKEKRKDPYAARVPAFAQFIADRVGRLWVRDVHLADIPIQGSLSAIPSVASTWSVFDRQGHWLGEVTMPARFQPSDIGADYVLGTAIDADNVQTVALYRMGRATTAD